MPSFFFKDTAPTEISPLTLHDAFPIWRHRVRGDADAAGNRPLSRHPAPPLRPARSEEHTSELQSRLHLVCRLFFLRIRRPPRSPLLPYTTLFRSGGIEFVETQMLRGTGHCLVTPLPRCGQRDRKSTRLNSSHGYISYAVFFF